MITQNSLPKFTVITPSFNQGEFLEATILSILNQDYPNLEYILIDGGSVDGSLDVIHKYQKSFSYWVSEKDSGQSEAINKGLRNSNGKFVTWINSDDLLISGSLNKAANYFIENPSIAVVHGKTALFGDGLRKEKVMGSTNYELDARYLAHMAFPQPSSFFLREAIMKVGMLNEQLHYGMDFDLFLRMRLNFSFLSVDDIFSKYRLHGSSKSVSNPILFANEWAVVYSRLLRTFPNSEDLISHLRELNLYSEGEERYTGSGIVTEEIMRRSFFYFLLIQAHYHYDALLLDETQSILLCIKKLNPEFFYENNLNRLSIKSKWLNKPFISFGRRFSR